MKNKLTFSVLTILAIIMLVGCSGDGSTSIEAADIDEDAAFGSDDEVAIGGDWEPDFEPSDDDEVADGINDDDDYVGNRKPSNRSRNRNTNDNEASENTTADNSFNENSVAGKLEEIEGYIAKSTGLVADAKEAAIAAEGYYEGCDLLIPAARISEFRDSVDLMDNNSTESWNSYRSANELLTDLESTSNEARELINSDDAKLSDVQSEVSKVKRLSDDINEMCSEAISLSENSRTTLDEIKSRLQNSDEDPGNPEGTSLFLQPLSLNFLGASGGGYGGEPFSYICNGDQLGDRAISELRVRAYWNVTDITAGCASINDYQNNTPAPESVSSRGDEKPVAKSDGYYFYGWTVTISEHIDIMGDFPAIVRTFIPHAKKIENGVIHDNDTISFGPDDGFKFGEPEGLVRTGIEQEYLCKDGEILTGIVGRRGGFIDSIEGVCQKVGKGSFTEDNVDDLQFGHPTKYLLSGGEQHMNDDIVRSDEQILHCNDNGRSRRAVVGFVAKGGSVVDGLKAACGTINSGYSDESNISSVQLDPELGGHDFGVLAKEDYVIVGWKARVGNYRFATTIAEFQPAIRKVNSDGTLSDDVEWIETRVGKGKNGIGRRLTSVGYWQEQLCEPDNALTSIEIFSVGNDNYPKGFVNRISGICQPVNPG